MTIRNTAQTAARAQPTLRATKSSDCAVRALATAAPQPLRDEQTAGKHWRDSDPKQIEVADIDRAVTEGLPRQEFHQTHDIWSMLAPAFESGHLILEKLNSTLIQQALNANGGTIAATARLLGLTRPQMAYRLKTI